MIVETVRSPETLALIAPEWERLPLPSPMQSGAWLLPWVQAYTNESDQLSVLVLYDNNGRLAGLAPFRIEQHAILGPTIRWIGDGRAASDHHTIICEPADRDEVVDTVASWLIEQGGQGWRRLRLEAIDQDDPAMMALEKRLSEAGLDTEWVPTAGTFSGDLQDPEGELSWEAFLATLSKNRRKKLRKIQRDLIETGRATFRLAETESDRQAMWPLLVQLHAERRHAKGEPGVFDDPQFNQFHEQASARLLAKGQLYFALLEIDGKPAAIEYAPQDDRAIYAYQGGIASWAMDQDAGHLSLIALVQHAISTGRTCLDLLRGDEPYKLSWGATRRNANTLHVRPHTLSGRLERWAGTAYRTLRDARSKKPAKQA